jgi:hypothetical protein
LLFFSRDANRFDGIATNVRARATQYAPGFLDICGVAGRAYYYWGRMTPGASGRAAEYPCTEEWPGSDFQGPIEADCESLFPVGATIALQGGARSDRLGGGAKKALDSMVSYSLR